MKFEWDEDKNIENQIKHGISFEEAKEVFTNETKFEYDSEHSTHDEDRFIAKGSIEYHGEILVVHAEVEDDLIRIISARRA